MHKMMMLRDNLEEELEKFADKQINEQKTTAIQADHTATECHAELIATIIPATACPADATFTHSVTAV